MAEKDTAIQEGGSRFPATAWSLLSRLRDPRDPRVQEYLNRMIEMYWRPIYKYVRIAWKRSNEDATHLPHGPAPGLRLLQAVPPRGRRDPRDRPRPQGHGGAGGPLHPGRAHGPAPHRDRRDPRIRPRRRRDRPGARRALQRLEMKVDS